MPEIEFVGDWDPRTVEAAVASLRKALGIGATEGAEETLQTTVTGLSARQRRLLDLLRKAGGQQLPPEPEPCDADPPAWEEVYPLQKAAAVGQMRVTPDGRILRLNRNRRWERVRSTGGAGIGVGGSGWSGMGGLKLPMSEGSYGRGVYLTVADQDPVGDGLRLRLRLAVDPSAIITAEQLERLAEDYAQDLELVLDGHGIRAVVEMDGPRVKRLMVRDPNDLEILGSLGGESVPQQHLGAKVIRVQPGEEGLVLDVELVERELTKGLIHGSPLLPAPGRVRREQVQAALDWIRARGGSLGGLPLRALDGLPDVAPDAAVVGWPGQRALYLVPNAVEEVQGQWVADLAQRLEHSRVAGAVDPGQALTVLAVATQLSPHQWLGVSLLSAAGAMLLSPDERYIRLLEGRGLVHWGNEAAVADCLGEDLRSVWIPEIPNLVTLEWDLACPEYARLGRDLALQMWIEKQNDAQID